MSLFKEIYGIMKDTEDGERLGLDAETIKRLVDEDVIPRRYSKGPGVGYPSKEEEEEALGVDDTEGVDVDVEVEPEVDDTMDAGEEDMGEPEGEVEDESGDLPEQILSYARELMDQGSSAEEAARQAADMIYDELVAELQGGCEECPDDEMGEEPGMGSEEDDYEYQGDYGSEEDAISRM